jgi:hypothetical protein
MMRLYDTFHPSVTIHLRAEFRTTVTLSVLEAKAPKFERVLTVVYNTQNYWVFGLRPSSGILEARKHNVSETEGGRHLLS